MNMLDTSEISQKALRALPIEMRVPAANNAYVLKLRNGESLTRAGQPLPGAAFLVQGAVSINRSLNSGDEVVLCFVGQNYWLLGDLVVTDQLPLYDSYAVGPATVIVWPSAPFKEAHAMNAELRELVRISAIRAQERMLQRMEETLALTLPQRLARRLLELAQLVGVPVVSQQGSIKLQAPVSHSLLASSLGVTRQRIHGQLREWSELGWLESRYREVVLHQPLALRLEAAYA
jgi:CRP/FNR family transcriptional regulator, cyclic AMP receptor protein